MRKIGSISIAAGHAAYWGERPFFDVQSGNVVRVTILNRILLLCFWKGSQYFWCYDGMRPGRMCMIFSLLHLLE